MGIKSRDIRRTFSGASISRTYVSRDIHQSFAAVGISEQFTSALTPEVYPYTWAWESGEDILWEDGDVMVYA